MTVAWQADEFGKSHEGSMGTVPADGSEPKPVFLGGGQRSQRF